MNYIVGCEYRVPDGFWDQKGCSEPLCPQCSADCYSVEYSSVGILYRWECNFQANFTMVPQNSTRYTNPDKFTCMNTCATTPTTVSKNRVCNCDIMVLMARGCRCGCV